MLEPEDNAYVSATIKTIALMLAFASTLLIPIVYATSANTMEVLVTVVLALTAWSCLLLPRLGWSQYAPQILVYSVLGIGVFALASTGSMRSAVTIMFVGGVAAAGIFLTRKALISSVLFSSAAMGVLTWAEINGHLVNRMSSVSIRVWIIETTGVCIVGFMVYFSRVQARRALERQLDELHRRIALEAERDQLRDRFSLIFKASPSPMLVQSAGSLQIIDINPALERCFGVTREDVLANTDLSLWADPRDRDRFQQMQAQNERVEQFKTKGRRTDGSTFEAVISSEWGKNRDDQLIVTTITDVSQHFQAAEHLRKSEERFAKAFNFIPLTLLIARMSDGLILEAHSARNGLEEIDIAAIRGKTSLQVGIWLNEADRRSFVDTLSRDGHINALDTKMRGRYGELFDARIWGERIEIEDEDCVLTCIVNVSEEKRREAQLRELAIAMTGQTSEELLQDLTHHIGTALGADLVKIGTVFEGQIRTLAAWKDGKAAPNFVYPLAPSPCARAMQGQGLCEIPNSASQLFSQDELIVASNFQAYLGQPLQDGAEQNAGILAVLWRRPVEVTAEMRALISICASRANAELQRSRHEHEIHHLNASLEQRVIHRTSELHKLNVELDSFAYSVSHDLKSPLRAIDGYAHILRAELDTQIDPNQVELLNRILAATHRMSNLIADLLALARVSQAHLELGPVNFSEMAQAVASDYMIAHPGKKVEVRIEPGLSCFCDANLTRIALENLLGNAFKYSRNASHPLIEFGRVSEANSEHGLFYVRDNGVGFDMAQAENLFKPFQRLHKPSEFEGSGIGLATVHRIVERHGGRIRARSDFGQGTTMYFTLKPTTEPAPSTTDQ